MACLRQIFIHLDGGPIFRPFFPIRPTFLHVCQPIEKNGSTTRFLLLFISDLAVEQLKFLSFSSFAENNRMLFVELLLR